MGEHIDKLILKLSVTEKVKDYVRRINGKEVHVSGHTRAGNGRQAAFDKSAFDKSKAAYQKGPGLRDKVYDALTASDTTAIDKKVQQDAKNEKAAKRQGLKPPMTHGASGMSDSRGPAYDKSKAAYQKGPGAMDKVKDALLGTHTTAIDKKKQQDEKNRKDALRKGEKPPMVHGASGMSKPDLPTPGDKPDGSLSGTEHKEFQGLKARVGKLSDAELKRYKALKAKAAQKH